MSMLDHPNVVKLFEIYDEPKKMMLVMELVPGLGLGLGCGCGCGCGLEAASRVQPCLGHEDLQVRAEADGRRADHAAPAHRRRELCRRLAARAHGRRRLR